MARSAFPAEAYREAEQHYLGQPRSCYRPGLVYAIIFLIFCLGFSYPTWFLGLPVLLQGQGGWMREGMVILADVLFPLFCILFCLSRKGWWGLMLPFALLLSLVISCAVGGGDAFIWLIWLLLDWVVLLLVGCCIFFLVHEIRGRGNRAYGCTEGFFLMKGKDQVTAVGRWDQIVEVNYRKIVRDEDTIKYYHVILAPQRSVELEIRPLWKEAKREFIRLHPHHLVGEECEDDETTRYYWRVEK